MKASYWQRGETLDYTNATNAVIEAGTVIELTGRIGIAGTNINPGEKGTIHVCGVFEFAKSSSNEISMGTDVYFDGDGITEAESGTQAGYAADNSAAGADTILVKIG